MSPDTSEEVGLEFHPHREFVVVAIREPAAHRLHLVADAELVLDVVADLVGDHVGLGKLARRAELPLQLVIEREVDVDLLVHGAVEGPRRGARHAAGALHLAGEHDELGGHIAPLEVRREQLPPHVLVLGKDCLDEPGAGIVGRLLLRLRAGLRCRGKAT